MRRVKYEYFFDGKTEIGEGNFHKFSLDYEEFETTAVNYSVAIVEREDGSIIIVPADNIIFLDKL